MVTQSPGMKRCLAALLVREAVAAAGARGADFQARSVLAPLLAVSTLPTYPPHNVLDLKFPARECFMGLRWLASVHMKGGLGRRPDERQGRLRPPAAC